MHFSFAAILLLIKKLTEIIWDDNNWLSRFLFSKLAKLLSILMGPILRFDSLNHNLGLKMYRITITIFRGLFESWKMHLIYFIWSHMPHTNLNKSYLFEGVLFLENNEWLQFSYHALKIFIIFWGTWFLSEKIERAIQKYTDNDSLFALFSHIISQLKMP